jgi:hypothetical protein
MGNIDAANKLQKEIQMMEAAKNARLGINAPVTTQVPVKPSIIPNPTLPTPVIIPQPIVKNVLFTDSELSLLQDMARERDSLVAISGEMRAIFDTLTPNTNEWNDYWPKLEAASNRAYFADMATRALILVHEPTNPDGKGAYDLLVGAGFIKPYTPITNTTTVATKQNASTIIAPEYWTPVTSKGWPTTTPDGGMIYYNKNAVYGKYNGSIPTDAVIVYPDGTTVMGVQIWQDSSPDISAAKMQVASSTAKLASTSGLGSGTPSGFQLG